MRRLLSASARLPRQVRTVEVEMENQLKASVSGTVSRILVAPGDLVESKAVLVELDSE